MVRALRLDKVPTKFTADLLWIELRLVLALSLFHAVPYLLLGRLLLTDPHGELQKEKKP
jgi:hypothetical protein